MIRPSRRRIRVGSDMLIFCEADGPTQWHFQSPLSLPSNVHLHNNRLELKNITLDNGGMYSCVGKYKNEEKYFYADSLVLVIGMQILNKKNLDINLSVLSQ